MRSLLLALCCSTAVWASGDFEVKLGAHSLEVIGRVAGSYTLPRNAERIGEGLHYRIQWTGADEVQVSSPTRWLPRSAPGETSLRLQTDPGIRYVTSLASVSTGVYRVSDEIMAEHPLFAFGRLQVREHHFGKSVLTEAFVPGALAVSDAQLEKWVDQTGQGVADYFGHFPVDRATLLVTPLARGSIQGVTYGEGGPYIRLQIPTGLSAAEIADSWQLCHEMVHLAVPDMPYQHRWLEEGIATYVEPLIRRQMGQLSSRRVWADLVDGLPQGLTAVEDGGLDGNPSWGATYWGGALFCLLSDVRLRSQSHNQFGLQQALRGVVARGNITRSWSLAQFLETADGAVHSQALEQVHQEMSQRSPIHLDQLWQKLGVQKGAGGLKFVAAPLDFVRQGIAADS